MLLSSKCKLIITAISLTMFLSGCGNDKSSQEYIESAKILIEEGKEAEAIIDLKNLLKDDAKNGQGRFLLGLSYANQGSWLAAEKELNKALSNKLDKNYKIKAQEVLAYVYSHLGDSAGIENLAKSSDKSNKIIQYFLATSYLSDGEKKLGLKILNEIVNAKKPLLYAQLSQSWIYSINKNFDKAMETLNELPDKESNSAVVIELKARTLFAAKQMKLALEFFEQYLAMRPQDHQNRLMYALALADSANFNEAEKQADLLLEINKSNSYLNQIKAQARFSEKDYEEAKKHAELAIQSTSDLPVARIIAGFSAYQLQQPEIAYEHLIAVKDVLSYQHPAKKLLNGIRFQLGYVDESFLDLSQTSLSELDTNILSLSAAEFFKIGEMDKAIKLIDKAGEIEPDNALIMYQKGVMQLFNNDDSAIDLFKSALEKNPELDAATVMLVMELIKDKKYDDALNSAMKIEDKNPELANSLIGGVYNHQGNIKKAKLYFDKVISLNNKHIGALFNLAKIAQAENKIVESLSMFEQILTIDEQHIPSLVEVLKLAKNIEVSDKVEKLLKDQVLKNEMAITPVIALAEYYIAKDLPLKAKTAIQASLKLKPNTVKLLMEEAKADILLKNYSLALETINKVLMKDDKNSTAYAAKSRLLLLENNLTGAIQAQEIAVKLNNDSFIFKLQLAFLYIENYNIKMAKKIEKSLYSEYKTDINFVALQGRIAFVENDYEKAISILSGVYKQQPSEQVLLELVTSLQNTAKVNEALTLLVAHKVKSSKALSAIGLLKLAELYSDEQPLKAIETYNKLIDSKDEKAKSIVFNNLAWLHFKQKNKVKALANADKAIALAPEMAAIQDTYGYMLLVNNKNEKALVFSKKAHQGNKHKQNYKLHYIEALIANSKNKEAKRLVESIKSSHLKGDELISFKNILRKL